MPTIDSLATSLSSYLEGDQINLVRRAYYYAEQAHDGQFRRSGDPYVTHPLAVAGILSEMHMDPPVSGGRHVARRDRRHRHQQGRGEESVR